MASRRLLKRSRGELGAEQNAADGAEPAADVGQHHALASAGRGRSVSATDEAPASRPADVAPNGAAADLVGDNVESDRVDGQHVQETPRAGAIQPFPGRCAFRNALCSPSQASFFDTACHLYDR
jgi:hypothetical protein